MPITRVILECASIIFLAGSMLLLAAGTGHARQRTKLMVALIGHRFLPVQWIPPLTWLLIGSEVVIGVSGIFAVGMWQFGHGLPLVPVVAQAALYTLFFSYLTALARLRPGIDCGCSSRAMPVNGFTIGRAAVLAAAAATFLMLAMVNTSPEPFAMPQVAMTWLGSTGLSVVLAITPHAFASAPTLTSKV